MNRNISLLISLCMIMTSCSRSNDRFGAINLRCEYQTAPVGVGVSKPHFGWTLLDTKHSRGQSQTAYNILVASSPEILTDDEADVWNSGKVYSSESVSVAFDGKPLRSSAAYFWKVQVYDKDDKPSEWSVAERFVTGVLDSADWDAAAWIRHPDAPRVKHIWFRKNLYLDQTPESAFIHVASLGHHELYVNGEKADDRVLAPALTNFDKRLFYVTYDVSKILEKGDNVFGLWFASGWASYDCFSRTPALRIRLDGKDSDGKTITLLSDSTWRCAVSNSEDTRSVLTYNNNGSEIVDARNFIPDWNSVSFDDSKWAFAATTSDNDSVKLDAHDIEPSRIIEVFPAQSITDAGDGVYKVDFGKNFTGWLNIRFNGLAAGDTVIIGSADDDKSFDDFNTRNIFVSAGNDGEIFSNRFNYVAGRYANIRGLNAPPKIDDFIACAISTGLERTGWFKSSNELFNKIFETDLWTFLANTTEGYTSDCPHRERCGYGETATATSWGIGLPNYETGAFFRNVVRNWRDVQLPDGWGRNTAPQPNDYHWGGALWSSAGLNVAWEHYMHYGDMQILELIYPVAKRWLEFLHANVSEGLLRKYRKHDGQFLGDWLAPDSRSEFGSSDQALYFNNCVYAMNLETFVKIARLLNKPEDASLYSERLTELRPAIRSKFYDSIAGIYSDGTQVQQAFALLTGLTKGNESTQIENFIATDMSHKHPYFDMGSSGLTVLMHYLTERPQTAELAATILNRTDFPGYGYFIAQGETTWPEDWKIDVPSKIHTCYTGIAGWFTKGLCGIQPDENCVGYKHFIVKPFIVAGVDFAEASIGSPYGEIRSGWERKDNEIILSITVPPNTSARVYIPTSHPERVTENGKSLNDAEGITQKNIENGYLSVETVSGQYRFISVNDKTADPTESSTDKNTD